LFGIDAAGLWLKPIEPDSLRWRITDSPSFKQLYTRDKSRLHVPPKLNTGQSAQMS